MALHSIKLRGPWEVQPLLRAVILRGGLIEWSRDVPPSRTVQMPSRGSDVLAEFRGYVRFVRRFNCPTNLGPNERIRIVFFEVVGAGRVLLNDATIGDVGAEDLAVAIDVTDQLKTSNVLQVELHSLHVTPGLPGLVALEIAG